MKALLIGTQGQLARSLIEASRSEDIELLALGRPTIDLRDPASCVAAISEAKPDAVINAAAYTMVDKAETEPEAAFAVNALGAEALARACAARDIPVLHISTDYVFDGTKPTAYVEDDRVAPLGIYGRSKLEGERRVAAACARHLILRTSWVHSPYGSNFVKTMLRLAGTRDEIAVVDDQVGNPTYAPHLAVAILTIAKRAIRERDLAWGTYHAAGTGDVTWCGLARQVLRVADRLGGPKAAVRAITTADYPTPARRPANSRLDCNRMHAVLGPRLPPWQDGVEDCVRRILSARAENQ
jgi:dTDP-4-dehydrorhamnose reductase